MRERGRELEAGGEGGRTTDQLEFGDGRSGFDVFGLEGKQLPSERFFVTDAEGPIHLLVALGERPCYRNLIAEQSSYPLEVRVVASLTPAMSAFLSGQLVQEIALHGMGRKKSTPGELLKRLAVENRRKEERGKRSRRTKRSYHSGETRSSPLSPATYAKTLRTTRLTSSSS